jgi:hypothetical protein
MKPVTETRAERPALNLVRRLLNYLRRNASRLRPPPWRKKKRRREPVLAPALHCCLSAYSVVVVSIVLALVSIVLLVS